MSIESQVLPQMTLEQWAVFRSVIEEGSFARAAEHLNKSQSSVSYVISNMESRLPSPALVLKGRKAELTDVGKYLYRQVCTLLDQAVALDRSVQSFAQGWEEEISIAVDAIAPMNKVFDALQLFSERCPDTRVRILETTLSGTDQAVLERRVQLAVAPHAPTGFLSEVLWHERMFAVVGEQHPLAHPDQPITENELAQHRQIVVRDTGTRREVSAGWLQAQQRWTVSHFSSSVEAVKAGLGFAFIPESKIVKDLESGALVRLQLEIPAERALNVNMVLTDQSLAGPAVQALAEALRSV